MSDDGREFRDLLGSPVVGVYLAIMLSWVAVSQSNAGHQLDFAVLGALAVFAVPRVRRWVWDRWDVRSLPVVWGLRVIYALAGLVGVAYVIGEDPFAGPAMLALWVVLSVGVVFGVRVWRSVRNAAQ